MKYDYQVKALNRWEFSYDGHFDVYRCENEGAKITWSVTKQFGAYYFDEMVTLINNWDELDSLMEQTAIY